MGRFPEVEAIISELIGLDTESIGARPLKRAVEKRLALHPNESYGAFLAGLRAGGPQLDDLIERLVVPETWFFRDQQAFELLRQCVSDGGLIDWAGNNCGCSGPVLDGEEAYSIAISLWERADPLRFRLDAWDISNQALLVRGPRGMALARSGGACRALPALLREGGGPGASRARDCERGELLSTQSAPVRRLSGGPPLSRDFCKNLTIYLTAEARAALVSNVKRLLHPEGLLFVGHSEAPLFLKSGSARFSSPGRLPCVQGRRSAAPAAMRSRGVDQSLLNVVCNRRRRFRS